MMLCKIKQENEKKNIYETLNEVIYILSLDHHFRHYIENVHLFN